MNTFYCTLTLLNKDEWLQYATNVIKSNKHKNPKELLKEFVTFDFKFGTDASS